MTTCSTSERILESEKKPGKLCSSPLIIIPLTKHNRPHTKTHSGVWRDLAVHKRKTEVDMIMGAVLPFARKHGIAIPLTTRVIEAIHMIEDGKDVQGDHHLDRIAKTVQN
jgi:2-dehydropantoate 2-reductase